MKILITSVLVLLFFGATAQNSLNMNLMYQWKDTTLTTSIIGSVYSEVWGYAKNGREYAIIGSTEGTHFFDVTDLNAVDTIAFVPGKLQNSQVIHRDYDTYQNYLYMVCDEGPSSLQIIDLSFLPDSVPLVYDEDTLINTSHNIFIDTVAGNLYSCGGANNLGANFLSVYSLTSNPLSPELLVNCSHDVPFWDGTIGYVHDIYVKNDVAYCNAGENGLFVVDFSNMMNVQGLGALTNYVQKGYNHSGWLHESGGYYAFADETAGMDVKVVDVTDLNDITLIDTIGSNVNQSKSMPHNVIFNGDLLYVSFYEDGLYVFNTSDPTNITLEGYYDTTELPYVFAAGNWGVYPFLPSGKILASDEQEGLLVFETFFTVGILENKRNDQFDFVIYPNPSKGIVTVLTNGELALKSYSIRNIIGKTIKRGIFTPSQKEIDVSNFTPGIYFLLITESTGNIISKKVILN
jgi:choice-of-anchor B domain-containing protein